MGMIDSKRKVEVLYTPYCPIGLDWVRERATRLQCDLVEYNIWELDPHDAHGLPPHVRQWVERAWSGQGGFGPYSPVFWAGKYYDLDDLDRLEADASKWHDEAATGGSGGPATPGPGGSRRPETASAPAVPGSAMAPPPPVQPATARDPSVTPAGAPLAGVTIRPLDDPADITRQLELGARITRQEQKSGGPLAFCGHCCPPCKTKLWTEIVRRHGTIGLAASLDGRECAMVTFFPKPVARRLGWGTSPDGRDLDLTLSVACLVVQPYARGRGLGKALVRAVTEYARGNGYRRVEAATHPTQRTPPDGYGWQTTGLFTSQGWQVVPGEGAPWLPVMVALDLG